MINQLCSGSACTWTYGPSGGGLGKVITAPQPATQAEADERDARVAEWEQVCLPVVAPGRDGVRRYTYGPACPDGVIAGSGRRP